MNSSNSYILEVFNFKLCSAFSNNNSNSGTVYSLLTFGLFLIFLALTPNLRVESVSTSLYGEGEHVIINVVRELPPRDSYKTLFLLK